MTPQRLEEIKDLIRWYRKYESIGLSIGSLIPDLVAEVERLTAQNASLQAELDELRRGLEALGRVDLGG